MSSDCVATAKLSENSRNEPKPTRLTKREIVAVESPTALASPWIVNERIFLRQIKPAIFFDDHRSRIERMRAKIVLTDSFIFRIGKR